jgi:hypothetical protein
MDFDTLILMESVGLDSQDFTAIDDHIIMEGEYKNYYTLSQMEEKLERFKSQEELMRHKNPAKARLLQISIHKLEREIREMRRGAA